MLKSQKLLVLFFFVLLVVASGVKISQQHSDVNAMVSATDPVYIFRNFTPPGAIMDLAFEGDYVWAATMKGVVRWNRHDGTFVTYTTADGLPDNRVWSVAIDLSGNKWFGTQTGGLSKFNGSSWTTFNTSNGLPNNFITTISVHPNGSLYLGTGSGVVGYNGSSFFSLPIGGPSARITAVAFDKNQNIWVGTYDSGSYKLNGITWTLYGDPATGPGGSVRDIRVAPNGDIWFAFDFSFSGSIGRMSGNTWTRFTTANGLVSDYAQSLDFDASGSVWAAFSDSQSGGIAKFTGSNWSQTDIRQNVGLDFTYVTKARADESGQLWFISNNYLFTHEGTKWKVYLSGLPVPPLLGSPNMAIAPNGDVWLSVARVGVVHYDGGTWKLYTRANGLAGDNVREIFIDLSGNVWMSVSIFDSVSVGVNKFDGTTWSLITTANGLPNSLVYSIAQDGAGNMWFGTFNGLSKYDGASWTTYTTVDGLIDNRVSIVDANGSNVWIAYGNAGISHFDGLSWMHYNTTDGLTSNEVSAIDFDSAGNPWVAAGTGINHFTGVNWDAFPITIGAPIIYTTGLVVDANGDVWVSGNNSNTSIGLARFSQGEWHNYNSSNGLLSDSISYLAINEARNEIWFSGGDQGVTRLQQFYGLDQKVYLPFSRK